MRSVEGETGHYITSLVPTAYDDTDDPRHAQVVREYQDVPAGTFVISGPLGPHGKGKPPGPGQWFQRTEHAMDMAVRKYGRVIRRIVDAEKHGRWALIVPIPAVKE